MACKETCELVDWWVSELTTYSITETGWEEWVDVPGGGVRVIEHDPPHPQQLTGGEVLWRVREALGLLRGMESGSTPCGRDCRCVRTGKWVTEFTGTVRDSFETVVMTPDARIRYNIRISFEAVVEKRKAPGRCVSVRVHYVPDLNLADS